LSEKLKSREAEIESLRTELQSAKKSEQHVHPMLRGLSPLSAPPSEYGDEDDVEQTLQLDEDEDTESTQMDVDISSSPTVVPSMFVHSISYLYIHLSYRLLPTSTASSLVLLSPDLESLPSFFLVPNLFEA
jgi:hypothetical protein